MLVTFGLRSSILKALALAQMYWRPRCTWRFLRVVRLANSFGAFSETSGHVVLSSHQSRSRNWVFSLLSRGPESQSWRLAFWKSIHLFTYANQFGKQVGNKNVADKRPKKNKHKHFFFFFLMSLKVILLPVNPIMHITWPARGVKSKKNIIFQKVSVLNII